MSFTVMKKTEKSPELEKIAARLKEIRKEKGFKNYEHIAFELGMSRSAYWRLESGENFSLKTLVRICKLLEITLEDFFAGISVPKIPSKKKKK